MQYLWENSNWPTYNLDKDAVSQAANSVYATRARMAQALQKAGFEVQQAASLDALTEEVVQTSAIENEIYSAKAVRSSIARKIGLLPVVDPGAAVSKKAEAAVTVLLDATRNFSAPITEDRIKVWHHVLMAHSRNMIVGDYRQDDMQVISGHHGQETVHFEAPPAERLASEMSRFCAWADGPAAAKLDPLVKSAVAHLWFVTVHPFEDGNGRIGRAIGELFLARADQNPMRYYSYSAAVYNDRENYYNELERAQKGSLDITPWTLWSLATVEKAIETSLLAVQRTVEHSRLWSLARGGEALNARQMKMMPKILDGFPEGIQSGKWASAAGCSQDTAARDIDGMVALGILKPAPGAGRNTRFVLAAASDIPVAAAKAPSELSL